MGLFGYFFEVYMYLPKLWWVVYALYTRSMKLNTSKFALLTTEQAGKLTCDRKAQTNRAETLRNGAYTVVYLAQAAPGTSLKGNRKNLKLSEAAVIN